MTDRPDAPLFTTPARAKRWRVVLSDGTPRTVEAHGFRVEGGALVMVLPTGCAAAYAAGVWRTVEEARDARLDNDNLGWAC